MSPYLWYIEHGSNGAAARPPGEPVVLWIGAADPVNAVAGDLRVKPAGALVAGTASVGTITSSSVELIGTAPSGGTAPYAYQWERSADAGASWGNIAGATTLTHTDTGLTASTAYSYRLRQEDSASAMVYTNEVSATTGAVGSGIAHVAATGNTINSGTTLTLNVPSGVTVGDVMIASVATRATVTVTGVPSGWSLVRSDYDGTFANVYTYQKVAGSSEPAGYAWTISASSRAAGGVSAYRGVSNSDPIAVHGGVITSGTQTTATAPSVTTPVDGCYLACVFAASTSSSESLVISPPSGMAQRWFGVSTGASVVNVASLLADEVRAGAGATGTRSAALDTARSNPVGQSIALRPA